MPGFGFVATDSQAQLTIHDSKTLEKRTMILSPWLCPSSTINYVGVMRKQKVSYDKSELEYLREQNLAKYVWRKCVGRFLFWQQTLESAGIQTPSMGWKETPPHSHHTMALSKHLHHKPLITWLSATFPIHYAKEAHLHCLAQLAREMTAIRKRG